MSTLTLAADPVILHLEITDRHLIVELEDGRRLSVPLAWYPRLLDGTVIERQNWDLFGEGTAIEWPDLDEHIEIEGLLAGRRSGESQRSFDRWLAGRQGGSELTDDEKREIDRRIAEHDADRGDFLALEQLNASIQKKQ
jgi:putative addiction module component (TIGR02574 family)